MRGDVYLPRFRVVVQDEGHLSLTGNQIIEVRKPARDVCDCFGPSPRAYVGRVSSRREFGQRTVIV